MNPCFFLLLLLPLLSNAARSSKVPVSSNSNYFITAASSLLHWSGRYLTNTVDNSVTFDWVNTNVRISVNNTNFTYLSVTINDQCNNGNKFVVRMIDTQGVRALDVATFYTGYGLAEYPLFSSIGRLTFWGENATFILYKAVEARFTQCTGANNLTIIGFSSNTNFIPAANVPTRKIEVIGDSITCGDLVYCYDPFHNHQSINNSLWTDNSAIAYGNLLGYSFNADVSTVAWGGMGLLAGDVASWLWPTIPDVYPSTFAWEIDVNGPNVSVLYPWDFSLFIPDAVIINLGTNDAAGERFNNITFYRNFVQRYITFIQNITTIYANARARSSSLQITSSSSSNFSSSSSLSSSDVAETSIKFFLGAGPMTNAYESAVQDVVGNVTTFGIPVYFLNMSLTTGCQCGHPSDQDHLTLAQSVQPFIAKIMNW